MANEAATFTADLQKACAALRAKVGEKADISVSISPSSVSGFLYTKGMGADRDDIAAFSVWVSGNDPFKMLEELELRWVAEAEKRGVRIIEKMALEIIRLTAEWGSCTDAALRAEFGEQVAIHSEAALTAANRMASNGPFSIDALPQQNAA